MRMFGSEDRRVGMIDFGTKARRGETGASRDGGRGS